MFHSAFSKVSRGSGVSLLEIDETVVWRLAAAEWLGCGNRSNHRDLVPRTFDLRMFRPSGPSLRNTLDLSEIVILFPIGNKPVDFDRYSAKMSR
jgi:hypothetical protein